MPDVNEIKSENVEEINSKEDSSESKEINKIEIENTKDNNSSYYNKVTIENQSPIKIKLVKENGWSNAEKISFISILISLALFIITLISFQVTKKSVKISEAALNDSRIIQRKRDSLDSIKIIIEYIRDTTNTGLTKKMLISQENSIMYSDIINRKTIGLAEKSLKEQINSLNENRKEFEAENRPVVQISDIKIENLKVSQIPFISFKYVNLGKLPAKLLNVQLAAYFDYPHNENAILNRQFQNSKISNSALSNQATISGNARFSKEFSQDAIDYYTENKLFFYLKIKYTYMSISTKKSYTCLCLFKIGNSEFGISVEGLTNEEY